LDEVGSDDTSSTSNDALEYDFASEESMEDEIVFDEILVLIKKQFDELTKEIFELIYRDRLKQRDVAVILFNRGRYSSEQSAAVVVSRVIKNKINPAVASLYPELFQ
jgi:tRNA(Ser,Leu) C12 N-acetylase TAN1